MVFQSQCHISVNISISVSIIINISFWSCCAAFQQKRPNCTAFQNEAEKAGAFQSEAEKAAALQNEAKKAAALAPARGSLSIWAFHFQNVMACGGVQKVAGTVEATSVFASGVLNVQIGGQATGVHFLEGGRVNVLAGGHDEGAFISGTGVRLQAVLTMS